MIAIIRITGGVGKDRHIVETLEGLKLGRKYSCTLISEDKTSLGMLKKVENFVAYGEIDDKTLMDLVRERAKIFGKKNEKPKNPDKIAAELSSGKTLKECGLKPFFGLHPPRGGINTKLHFPKGVIGNHGKEINKLIAKML